MQRSCETRSVGAAQRPQKRWVVAHSMISVARPARRKPSSPSAEKSSRKPTTASGAGRGRSGSMGAAIASAEAPPSS